MHNYSWCVRSIFATQATRAATNTESSTSFNNFLQCCHTCDCDLSIRLRHRLYDTLFDRAKEIHKSVDHFTQLLLAISRTISKQLTEIFPSYLPRTKFSYCAKIVDFVFSCHRRLNKKNQIYNIPPNNSIIKLL